LSFVTIPFSDWSIGVAYDVFYPVQIRVSPPLSSGRSFLAILFLAFGLNGCADDSLRKNESANNPGCGTRIAQIAVHDGSFEILCGCAEPQNQVFFSDQLLTCTVPTGTVVKFYFLDTQLRHQLIPTGNSEFPVSALFSPEYRGSNVVHPVSFPQAGSYSFADAFISGLRGIIVVQ
jgi:hypothetical protein